MTALSMMRVLLGVLEFIEFLIDPIRVILTAYVSLYCRKQATGTSQI
jgi:hypothetical protein